MRSCAAFDHNPAASCHVHTNEGQGCLLVALAALKLCLAPAGLLDTITGTTTGALKQTTGALTTSQTAAQDAATGAAGSGGDAVTSGLGAVFGRHL